MRAAIVMASWLLMAPAVAAAGDGAADLRALTEARFAANAAND